MSGKFKRSQRHQRWNDDGTCWSEKYLAEIARVEGDAAAPAPLRSLVSELRGLSRAQHTFGEVEELRRVLGAFQKVSTAAAASLPSPPAPTEAASGSSTSSHVASAAPAAATSSTQAVAAAAAAAAANTAGGAPEPGSLATACQLLAGLMFQYGSRMMHRTILGVVKRLPPDQLDIFGRAITQRLRSTLAELDEAGSAAAEAAKAAAAVPGQSARPAEAAAAAATAPPPSSVPLAEVVASLLWLPASYDWVRPVVAAVVWRLAAGVDAVLVAADRGQLHIAPGLMEEVLDAVGALYYLLQNVGRALVDMATDRQPEAQPEEQEVEAGGTPVRRGAREAVVLAGAAMLRALQGRALVREALASAAVVLWAAALLPNVAPAAGAAAFGQGLFFLAPAQSPGAPAGAGSEPVLVYDSGGDATAGLVAGDAPLGGWLDDWLRSRGSSLVSELRKFSPIGRICSLKGLVTAMPREATCAQLWLAFRPEGAADLPRSSEAAAAAAAEEEEAGQQWHFLVDGALSYGCSSIRDAPDAHFKFHAACVLCFCVSKVLGSWQQQQQQQQQQGQPQVPLPQVAAAEHGESDLPSETPPLPEQQHEQLQSLQPALLRPASLDLLMGLMWGNLDEPLAQTARQLQDAFQQLLEVLTCQDCYAPGVLPPLRDFKRQVVAQLLAVPYNRKGRYAPLGCLAERGCALAMLRDHPALIPEALLAMQSDTTASAASSFLKTLLAAARTEASSNPALAAEAAAAAASVAVAGPADGAASSPWVSLWRAPLLRVLFGGNEKLRAYVSVHALPVVLGLEPTAALELIHATLADGAPEPVPGTSRVAALVAVLKAARGMGLVADLDALVASGARQRLPLELDPEALLTAAVGHASESIRLDALELACVAFKMSDPPGRLELSIAGRWLALCMRSTAQGSRNKCLVLVTKLVARIRMAVAHIYNKMGNRGGPAHPSSSKGKGLVVLFSLGLGRDPAGGHGAADSPAEGTDPRVTDAQVLARLQAFMQWLTNLLVSGLYPGAPYERRFFALELLSAVLEAWGPDGSGATAATAAAEGCGGGGGGGRASKTAGGGKADGGRAGVDTGVKGGGGGGSKVRQPSRMAESTSLTLLPRGYHMAGASGLHHESAQPFRPYCPELLTSNTVALLLAGAVDSWDKLRQAASSCLMRLPTPLPGLATGAKLTPLLAWAVGLLWSPRARESDAGARLIKILYGKYVAEHGWRLQLHPTPRALPPPAISATQPVQLQQQQQQRQDAGSGAHASAQAPYAAVLDFLDAVLGLLDAQVATARQDLAAACRRSLAHGPLLLLRYVVEDVPWAEVATCREGATAAAAAAWAARALAAAEALVEVTLPVLSRPQERNVGAEEVETGLLELAGSEDDAGDDAEGDGGQDGEGGDNLGPEAQVIITACWTTVKEVALVLATMVRHMPLPTAVTAAASAAAAAASSGPPSSTPESSLSAPVLLSCDQLRRIGDLLVRLLFEMKHNGAVDKTSLALTAVSERLLRASLPELNGLPRPWLEACIRRVLAPGQSRDDIVRRSAGLPFAFGALFLAEPGNAPKQLLGRGMGALLAVTAAATSPCLMAAAAEPPAPAPAPPAWSGGDGQEAGRAAIAVVEVDGYEVRQVWPVVHAFNCLRHAFNDSNLAVDTSAYFAQAIQACLRALRSPAWEIRNSAMLCFTALTARVLGFKNDSHGESCRKAVSGAEFFQRYPALHGFLLAELQEAAAELEAAGSADGGRRSAAALANPHPGLYPVLIILSRLKASHIREDSVAAQPTSELQQQQQQTGKELVAEDGGGETAAMPPPPPPASAGSASAAVATYMGGLSPVAFTPLVRRCATAAPYAVRRLAARALGPLVAAQDVPALLQQLLSAVPAEPRDGRATSAVVGPGGEIRIGGGGSNALHGALLEASALLESAAADMKPGLGATTLGTSGSGAGQCGDALSVALPCLSRGAWLADPRVGCSALGCGLLQAAGAALVLLPPSRCAEFKDELSTLSAVCRRAVSYEPPAVWRQRQLAAPAPADGRPSVNVFTSDYPDPMRSQMLKLAVQLWLGPVLQGQAFRSSSPASFFVQGLLHQLRCCLASYSYDTRAAALKSLVRFLSAVSGGVAVLAAPSGSLAPTSGQLQDPSDGGVGVGTAASVAASAGMLAAVASATGGAADAGGKLPQLVADLLTKPALLRSLTTEGMALLWEAVASEPVHKVVRRVLKALGLLHALSTSVPAAEPSSYNAAPSSASEEGAEPDRGREVQGGLLLGHPLGCVCCAAAADPRVGDEDLAAAAAAAAAAATADLNHALSHVALVQRILTMGCKELEARCEALRCLGRALGSAMRAVAATATPVTRGSVVSASLLAALTALLDQVEVATQPWQPEDWRLAGGQALAASRLLQSAVRPQPRGHEGLSATQQQEAASVLEAEAASERLALLAIRGWRCVIAFLEDEDHTVRSTAARLAQEAMQLSPAPETNCVAAAVALTDSGTSPAADGAAGVSGSGSGTTAATTRALEMNDATLYGRQTMYVEAVIRQVYPWLAVQYGGCSSGNVEVRTALVLVLRDLISTGVYGGSGGDEDGAADTVPDIVNTMAGSAGAAATVGWASQARRLFDKEDDNPHAEPLLTAQLAARTLRALLAAPTAAGASNGGGTAASAVVSDSGSMTTALAAAAVLKPGGAEQLVRGASVAAEHIGAVAAAVAAAGGGGAAAGDAADGSSTAVADGWLGGFINHAEVFTCAYKALLELWALGPVRHAVLAATASATLADALHGLLERCDVLGSQLAPLLRAVEAEWSGVGGTPFPGSAQDEPDDRSSADAVCEGGVGAASSLISRTGRGVLFLL